MVLFVVLGVVQGVANRLVTIRVFHQTGFGTGRRAEKGSRDRQESVAQRA